MIEGIRKFVNETVKYGYCMSCGKWEETSILWQQDSGPEKRKQFREERQAWLDLPLLCQKCM